MALLDDYTLAADENFRNKIVAAMSKKATEWLQGLDPQTPPSNYSMVLKFAKHVLSSFNNSVYFISRAFVSAGITNASDDTQIQAAVDNNFEILAYLYDPDVFIEESE